MTTVATIITDAMFAGQLIGQDQTPSSADSQLMLRIFKRMMDTWSNEKQMVYVNSTESFTMTAGVNTYSTSLLAPGRPVAINSMTVKLNNIYYPVDMIDILKWNAISYKITSAIPNQCYYNASFPDGTMYFYPTPYAAFECFVDCQYPLAPGTLTLASDLTLPEGYEDAMVSNLAIRAWGSFKSGSPSPAMIATARETKGILKRNNFFPLEMQTPFGGNDSDISNSFLYKGF